MVDFLHFSDLARHAGGQFSMLTGCEEMLLSSLVTGGKGCMSATAGILPEIMVGIYRHWQVGDQFSEKKTGIHSACHPRHDRTIHSITWSGHHSKRFGDHVDSFPSDGHEGFWRCIGHLGPMPHRRAVTVVATRWGELPI